MPTLESKLGGMITIQRETYEDRAVVVKEADQMRLEAVRRYLASGTPADSDAHHEAYQRVIDALNMPLETTVHILGVRIPGGFLVLSPAYFVKGNLIFA